MTSLMLKADDTEHNFQIWSKCNFNLSPNVPLLMSLEFSGQAPSKAICHVTPFPPP